MTQTIALFVDAYRELNSRKLFWITLILSGVIVLAFASVGIDKKGISILTWTLPIPGFTSDMIPPATLYKMIFSNFGIKIWLAWIATVLALVTTCGMFPDLIASGGIEMVLSKPISRLRLFLTKYVCGLLFAALQVGVFTGACFLVIGFRGGDWEPRLFLAVPLVVSVFSFLFCICTLVGLITRSTIASLLLTLLFWFVIFLVHSTEVLLLMAQKESEIKAKVAARLVAETERKARVGIEKELLEDGLTEDEIASRPPPTDEQLIERNQSLPRFRKDADEKRSNAESLDRWHRGFVAAKYMLPKTAETIELLDRTLMTKEDIEKLRKIGGNDRNRRNADGEEYDEFTAARQTEDEVRSRSIWWVLGTSFLFEGFVLLAAAWVFCRRDF